MSEYAYLLRQPLVLQLGWALVHFLWEGAVVALLVAAALRAMRGKSPEARYAVACLGLLMMAMCPVVTFIVLQPVGPVLRPQPPTFVVDMKGTSVWQLDAATLQRLIDESRPAPPAEPWTHRMALQTIAAVAAYVPWFVACWVAGVLVLAVWLIGSWGEVLAVAKDATPSSNRALVAMLDDLTIRMGIRLPVRLLKSARVQVPAAIGVLRPVVLFPAAALTGLSPAQIESILAHELAHVRRHDYLVNLLQSVIEAVLFYHPAVWWVSRRIRVEREHCCDDAAVAASGDREAYATALADLEELRLTMPPLAAAACG